MKIILNNEAITLNGTTIADLIAQTSPQNRLPLPSIPSLSPKARMRKTVLNENDKVDIVRPVVGG